MHAKRRSCAAIIPAAGMGTRMGTSVKKQFLLLDGEPILRHTLCVLHDCPEINWLILVVPEEDQGLCRERILGDHGFTKPITIVPGGRERQDSVHAGLRALSTPPDVVVVHDGVRPFLTAEMVQSTVASAAQGVSAVVGVPVSDTIKAVDRTGTVTQTISREGLWSIQTPQAFPHTLLRQAYDSAYRDGVYATDDAALIERLGSPVSVLLGSPENIKITSPEDLVIAEAILKRRLEHANRTRL